MAVGVSGDSRPNLENAGSVYVYIRQNGEWEFEAKLVASDASANDSFGSALAISGTTLMIGAYGVSQGDDWGAGAVYVFEKNKNGDWEERQKLMAEAPATRDYFGSSIAILADVAVVGAPYQDVLNPGVSAIFDVGAAYVFERDSEGIWRLAQKIMEDVPLRYARFGTSVGLSDDWLVIGRPHTVDEWPSEPGTVHVYTYDQGHSNQWLSKWELSPVGDHNDDEFGASLAVDGVNILVGAPAADSNGASPSEGAAYLFTLDSGAGVWSQQNLSLGPDDVGSEWSYGSAVALYGKHALVGADPSLAAGFVTAFFENGGVWLRQQKIERGEGQKLWSHRFARSLAVDSKNEVLLVGASGSHETAKGGMVESYSLVEGAWSLEQSISTGNGEQGLSFGHSWSSDGETLIVGALELGDGWFDNSESGAAYVFSNQGGEFSLQDKLKASDGVAGDYFGYASQVSGDIAFVGAPYAYINENAWQGAVYVYQREANGNDWIWIERQKLIADDGQAYDYFGLSLLLDGGNLLIGASGAEGGAIYVFRLNPQTGLWAQVEKILPPEGGGGAFGNQIVRLGNLLAVGASIANIPLEPTQPPENRNAGAVHLYEKTGDVWTWADVLVPSDNPWSAQFGRALDGDEETIVVGASGSFNCASGCDPGSVYVFDHTELGWRQTQVIQASDAESGGLFGRSVALSGDTMLIGAGAGNDSLVSERPGTVYAYVRNEQGWAEVGKLQSPSSRPLDVFGSALELQGDAMLIGARGQDDIDSALHGNTENGALFIRSFQDTFINLFRDRFQSQ
jgi:hypothetical protein